MIVKKRRLGSNLDQLLSSPSSVQTVSKSEMESVDGQLCMIQVVQIQPGRYQPRRQIHSESLQELADSIKSQGIIQPIVVRKINAERYEIVAGERRWRAAQIAGLKTVPAIIRELSNQTALAMALIENMQREDLNPIEEALTIQRLLEEFKMTHLEVAYSLGRARTSITNLLRLLSLSEFVKNFLEDGKIEMGHARALLVLEADKQAEVAELIVEKGFSVRQTEEFVKNYQMKKPEKEQNVKVDEGIGHLQKDISEKIGAPVLIRHSRTGKGRLIISYNSLSHLDRILGKIQA